MKKLLAALLAAAMLLSLSACGDKETPDDTPNTNTPDTSDQDSGVSDSENPGQDIVTPDEEEDVVYVPLDVLTTVWNNYPEDVKFPAAGGEVMDGPGALTGDFGTAESLDNLLAIPTADFDKISEPACLMHMMNANTFTCGAYTVGDADREALTKSVNDAIMNRQWMCGFPEKMFVATLGDCVISAFGHTDAMDTFKSTLTQQYPDTVFVYESNIE